MIQDDALLTPIVSPIARNPSLLCSDLGLPYRKRLLNTRRVDRQTDILLGSYLMFKGHSDSSCRFPSINQTSIPAPTTFAGFRDRRQGGARELESGHEGHDLADELTRAGISKPWRNLQHLDLAMCEDRAPNRVRCRW